MAKVRLLDDGKIGEISGTIANALRADHPDISLDELLSEWAEIGRTLPMAFTIHAALEDGLGTAVARLKNTLVSRP